MSSVRDTTGVYLLRRNLFLSDLTYWLFWIWVVILIVLFTWGGPRGGHRAPSHQT